jgi:hypothetical protein
MTPKEKKFGNSLASFTETNKGTKSSFPGVIYSGPRGIPFPNIFDWLRGNYKYYNSILFIK